MKITLQSLPGELAYEGTNDRGQTARFSGSKTDVSPMEHLLMAAAACSAIDVEILLQKMRSPATRVEVDVEGTRADAVPAIFTHMKLHYRIYGDVPAKKAEKVVRMSMEQYCSVSLTLQPQVKIEHSFEVL